MPTLITHIVIAGAAGKICTMKTMTLRFWVITIFCSIAPDFDMIGFRLGVEYGTFFGHRGFSHSLFFALLLSIILSVFFFKDRKLFSRRWWKYVLFFFLVGASHGILDAFTNAKHGIALLSPFDNTRYLSPRPIILVSPLSIRYFLSSYGLRVMISEIGHVWLPLMLVFILSRRIKSTDS